MVTVNIDDCFRFSMLSSILNDILVLWSNRLSVGRPLTAFHLLRSTLSLPGVCTKLIAEPRFLSSVIFLDKLDF